MNTENKNILVLSKEYEFEGKKIKEVDFSGLDNIRLPDIKIADHRFAAEQFMAPVPETTTAYATMLAGMVTEYPEAFFETLSYKDGKAVKDLVISLYDQEGIVKDGTKIVFSQEYKIKYKDGEQPKQLTCREIDLECLEDLKTSDIAKIEKCFATEEYYTLTPEQTLVFSVMAVQLATNLPMELFNALRPKDLFAIKEYAFRFFRQGD